MMHTIVDTLNSSSRKKINEMRRKQNVIICLGQIYSKQVSKKMGFTNNWSVSFVLIKFSVLFCMRKIFIVCLLLVHIKCETNTIPIHLFLFTLRSY